jgi:hypothetical protein
VRQRLTLSLWHERYAVVRLPVEGPWPDLTGVSGFVSVTRTDEELSVVMREENAPASPHRETGFRILKVAGPLDFALTGILADLAGALADAAISTFALSTFDTDYILVREVDLDAAKEALTRRGHQVHDAADPAEAARCANG